MAVLVAKCRSLRRIKKEEEKTMSLSSLSGRDVFVSFIGLGCGVPAIALYCFNYPDMIVKGLATRGKTIEEQKLVWYNDTTPESKFGLYMYTMSDVILSAICGATIFLGSNNNDTGSSIISIPTTKFALQATAIHQLMYLSAAIPAFGFKKEHISSIITALISGYLSLDA